MSEHDNSAFVLNFPVIYRVTLAPELVRMLEIYAAAKCVKPETAIAEAVRAYLGADA